nr:KH domain-containing protein At4g18375 [Tanacetum cinerariifolium]
MKWKPVHEFFHCAFAVLDLLWHHVKTKTEIVFSREAQLCADSPYLVFRSVGRNVGVFRHTSSCLGLILEDCILKTVAFTGPNSSLVTIKTLMETLFRVTPLRSELKFLKVHNVPYAGLFRLSSSALEMLVPGHAVGKVIGRGRANVDNIHKISGASVEISDNKSSCGDRVAVISGKPEQKHYFPGKRKRGKDYKEGMYELPLSKFVALYFSFYDLLYNTNLAFCIKVLVSCKEEEDLPRSPTMNAAIRIFIRVNGFPKNKDDVSVVSANSEERVVDMQEKLSSSGEALLGISNKRRETDHVTDFTEFKSHFSITCSNIGYFSIETTIIVSIKPHCYYRCVFGKVMVLKEVSHYCLGTKMICVASVYFMLLMQDLLLPVVISYVNAAIDTTDIGFKRRS